MESSRSAACCCSEDNSPLWPDREISCRLQLDPRLLQIGNRTQPKVDRQVLVQEVARYYEYVSLMGSIVLELLFSYFTIRIRFPGFSISSFCSLLRRSSMIIGELSKVLSSLLKRLSFLKGIKSWLTLTDCSSQIYSHPLYCTYRVGLLEESQLSKGR